MRTKKGKVSFIVTTRNSSRTLENCLASISAQTNAAAEIVVIDNRSTDGTFDIAKGLADVVEIGGPERSAQRNQGAQLASGEYLVFIDSDMVLPVTAAAEITMQFEDPSFHALVIPERVAGTGFWDKCRAIEKESYVGDEAVEAARAFRKSIFWELGGYDEGLTGPEDWELPDRLRRAGHRIGRIESSLLHDERTLGLKDAFMKKRYYGRSFNRFLSRTPSVKGRFLRASLLKPLASFWKDPLHVAGLYVLKAAELIGLFVGMLETKRRQENIY